MNFLACKCEISKDFKSCIYYWWSFSLFGKRF